METKELEQTLVLLKPDALQNSLTGYLLSQLSEFHTGLHLSAAKIVSVSKLLAEEHYAEHKGKGFYDSLLDYIMGALHWSEPWRRRVVAIVYQGQDAIKKIRDIAGPTNPHVARDTKPGCIRALGSIIPLKDASGKVVGDRMDNLIHASANPADAEREVKLWFAPTDVPPLMLAWATAPSDAFYWFKDGALSTEQAPGARCIAAPGDVLWRSDLEALQKIASGAESATPLGAVAAKYLLNIA
ncbi:MAG: nucleoside-diphosphate kinase [Acidobacteriota bacterium]|jgi:nucleoside-diphosphate kinase|nr:nucleoside-diphosphate kinase [Acidobacteriota bacterium]